MALERAAYRPRDAERGVLHRIVRAHLETFLREAAPRAGGAGLPQFVEQEFREFLTCGVLAPHARWRPRIVAAEHSDSIAPGLLNPLVPSEGEGPAPRAGPATGPGRS